MSSENFLRETFISYRGEKKLKRPGYSYTFPVAQATSLTFFHISRMEREESVENTLDIAHDTAPLLVPRGMSDGRRIGRSRDKCTDAGATVLDYQKAHLFFPAGASFQS
jgi:hypothetical protein